MNGRVARWAGTLSAAVVVLAVAAPAVAAAGPELPPLLHGSPSRPVPGHDVAPAPAARPSAGTPRRPPARAMPTAGAVELQVGRSTAPVSIGGLPVAVTAPAAGRPAATRVRVSVLDQASAARARLAGVLLRLTPAASVAPGRVRLTLNYARFRDSYGADWADRLTLLRLPDCALSTPDAAGCVVTPVATRNDARTQTVSAEVDMRAGAGAGGWGGTTVALAAGASGSTGDFTATSLSPTGSWQAGGSSGDFSWSYPLRVPPSPGGWSRSSRCRTPPERWTAVPPRRTASPRRWARAGGT
jgi:hypothetical protein